MKINIIQLMKNLLCSLLLTIVLAPLVSAQGLDPGKGSITINPLVMDMKLEKGKQYDREIEVKNISSTDYSITFETFDVSIEPTSHNVSFLPKESKQNARKSLASWVKPVNELQFELPAGETVKYPLKIEIPAGVDSGDYFASLNFYFRDANKVVTPGSVSVRQSLGSLLLVGLNGGGPVESLSDYQFSDILMNPNGKTVGVSVQMTNDSLRYVQVKPQLSIWSDDGEMQYQSVGKLVRVFPGDTQTVAHAFPKAYLSSTEKLSMGYVLWGPEGKVKYYEGEVALETAYDRMKVFQDLLVMYGEWFFFLAIVLMVGIVGGVVFIRWRRK